jgi:hypothetical protein
MLNWTNINIVVKIDMNIVVIINMLSSDDGLLTLHSHMLLCTFTFLVTLTSWGIHTKNILKVHNIFIIIFLDKRSPRLEVVSWHPFFNCTIVVVSMCFNHYYAIVVVLLCLHFNCAIVVALVLSFQLCHCYCVIIVVLLYCHAFITTTPSLLCFSFYNCEHSQCVK